MKKDTIKWRIFKYNIIVIILLVSFATVVFNVAVSMYIEKDIVKQLDKIAAHTESTALQRGPEFLLEGGEGRRPEPPPGAKGSVPETGNENDIIRFYFMLDRSLREPLSVLNADYILLSEDKSVINTPSGGYFEIPGPLLEKIISEIKGLKDSKGESYLNFKFSGTNYIAMLKPVSRENSFGLGWIVIYSSLQKVNQLQWGINIILFSILILSALVIMAFSSLSAKKISEPFSSLNSHIGAIAERNFGAKINMPVYHELQEFVRNINIMSEKLEIYDKAQKTFLQNASHEFRTPLMSIQSYAEGIKYDVVDKDTAANIIIDETKRMTHLVEDLLYLSRLDSIEENYHFYSLDLDDLINSCVERVSIIAAKNNIKIVTPEFSKKVYINADEEKLSRAITNVLSNCIRYARETVTIISEVTEDGRIFISISDDGPGFDPKELPYLFERFFKGKKGNFGLGLAISKNVIEKHRGKIKTKASESGALFVIELPGAKPHPF